MLDEDERFEQLLVAFEVEHAQRTRSLEAHMNRVKSILESENDGLQQTMNVKHAPISARLKDADKALRTLRRRQEDRKQLRDLKGLVQNRGHIWEEYCKEWNMEDKINEAEPFTNTEQMFEAMHDLAGIRISVYFPTDIKRVVEFLQGRHFTIVEQPSQKGGLTRDFQKVRKLVERQRRIHAAPEHKRGEVERREKTGSIAELTFTGYKATHVVIRLSKLDFDKHWRGDSITNIEVQIGSIVMHAWSDIEHGILYKPSEKEQTSTDVVQMLDLINGIVMTGEVALQQLSRVVAAAEATRQAANRTKPADNWHHVVTWFYAYFKEKRIEVPPEIEWSARYLFEILKATNEHTYARVETLLDQVYPQPKPEACLPIKLLQKLGLEEFEDPTFMPPKYATTWSARYWATCLVNTSNLALYMGCSVFRLMENHSSKNKLLYQQRPTFAEFVDILHPTKPHRRTIRDITMIEFCKHVLTTNFDHDPAAVAAMKLAAAGYMVRPPLAKEGEKDLGTLQPIFVPAMLKYLTQDTDISFDITLSLIGDEVYYDKNQYFIPCKEGNIWKPARRDLGKRWIITKHPFTNDQKLAFKDTKSSWGFFTDHLCKVLGGNINPAEVRALRNLALTLEIDGDEDKLRDLNKITNALGTKDVNKVRQFMNMADKVNDAKLAGGLPELAELACALNTMDIEELKEYRNLARSHSMMDVDELRALKRLADRHGTRDPRELKELRSKETETEELLAQEQIGAVENRARSNPSWTSRPPSRRPSPTSMREIAKEGRRAHDSLQYRS